MPKYKTVPDFACCQPDDTLGYTHCIQVSFETKTEAGPPHVVFP